MSGCTDKILGEMLAAYELGALSEKDREAFEIHFLSCEYCFNELNKFEQESNIVRNDTELIQATKRATIETAKTGWRRFLDILWPRNPGFFRPALLVAVILALIYPAYLGLRQSDQEVNSLIQITLHQNRSIISQEKLINSHSDYLLDFVVDEETSNKKYHIILKDNNNREIYNNQSFDDYDSYGVGRLIIPKSILHEGQYILIIQFTENNKTSIVQNYYFTIE